MRYGRGSSRHARPAGYPARGLATSSPGVRRRPAASARPPARSGPGPPRGRHGRRFQHGTHALIMPRAGGDARRRSKPRAGGSENRRCRPGWRACRNERGRENRHAAPETGARCRPFAVWRLASPMWPRPRPRGVGRGPTLWRTSRRRERQGVQAARVPSSPATSWMHCHATRPDRAPRVTDHSTARARRSSVEIGRASAAAYPSTIAKYVS
jgi:hypothetical protein